MRIELPPLPLHEARIIAHLCRRSLSHFVREFWEIIESQPLRWNWHIELLCEEMQALIERIFREEEKLYDEVFNIPPGTSKSTIITKMAPVWAWTRMPSFRTIAVSHAQSLALEHARKSRDIVQSEKFRVCFPEVGDLREDANAKGHYVNDAGGMRISTGMRGSIGHHGHLILVDDPIDPLAARSDPELQEAKEWMDGTLSTRKVDKAITPTVVVMQRLHVDDPSAHYLATANEFNPVRHICLPGELAEGAEVKPAYLKAKYTDGLLDPVRLSRKVLKGMEAKLGQFGYAAQVLQNPRLVGSGMFQTAKIRFGKCPPLEEFTIVRYWDNASTEDDPMAAQTAGCKMGRHKSGAFWILDMKAGHWASHERERIKLQAAHHDGVNVEIYVEQEPGSGGKDQAVATVGNLAGFRVHRDRPTGDKVSRADPFSVQVNEGNVWVPAIVIEGQVIPPDWWPPLEAQLAAFGPLTNKLKDMVDACSGAFGKLFRVIRLGAPMQRGN